MTIKLRQIHLDKLKLRQI